MLLVGIRFSFLFHLSMYLINTNLFAIVAVIILRINYLNIKIFPIKRYKLQCAPRPQIKQRLRQNFIASCKISNTFNKTDVVL